MSVIGTVLAKVVGSRNKIDRNQLLHTTITKGTTWVSVAQIDILNMIVKLLIFIKLCINCASYRSGVFKVFGVRAKFEARISLRAKITK